MSCADARRCAMSVVVDIRKKLATFDLEVSFGVGNETLGFLGASGCGK